MDDESEKFDLKITQVVRFQEMLHLRSEVMGWTHPSQGITTYRVDGMNCDLISEYGKNPYDAIKLSLKLIGNLEEPRQIKELLKTMR
jgi:hypothetical protein